MNEQKTQIQLLCCYINSEKFSPADNNIDWNAVLKLARLHQLLPVLHIVNKKQHFMDDQHGIALETAFNMQLNSFGNRQYVKRKLVELLHDYDFVFFKGDATARFYEELHHRCCGDIDLLIHEENLSTINDILLNNGFAFHAKESGVWAYRCSGTEVEVHYSLIHPGLDRVKFMEYFSDCWNHVENHEFDDAYHFIYMITHMSNHFREKGIGMKYFLDIALAEKNLQLDWNGVANELDKIGLLKFTEVIFGLNSKWFGVNAPIDGTDVDDAFAEEALMKVCVDGPFGSANEKNVGKGYAMHHAAGGSKVGYLFKQFFLPYDCLAEMEKFDYVRGRKYLLPVAWVHRAAFVLFKQKGMRTIKNKVMIDDEIREQSIEMMRQWGL